MGWALSRELVRENVLRTQQRPALVLLTRADAGSQTERPERWPKRIMRMIRERIMMYGHIGQVPLFVIAALCGLLLPFLLLFTVGHLFLPVPEAMQGTTQEDYFVRNVFVACGFAAVLFPALGAVLLLIRNRASNFRASVICAGLAVGALGHMLWLSPGGWCFIMR